VSEAVFCKVNKKDRTAMLKSAKIYKVVPVCALKTCMGSGSIAPLILNLGCRWR
jgi:hypothetical protein